MQLLVGTPFPVRAPPRRAMPCTDAVFILAYLFAEGPPSSCEDATDANDDGVLDIADAIATLGHLFGGAGDLPPPFGECGPDPTDDGLGCVRYPSCRE